MSEPLPEEKRKEIFLALVELQDEGYSIEESRTEVAEQFAIEGSDVREIEREGLANQWPPL